MPGTFFFQDTHFLTPHCLWGGWKCLGKKHKFPKLLSLGKEASGFGYMSPIHITWAFPANGEQSRRAIGLGFTLSAISITRNVQATLNTLKDFTRISIIPSTRMLPPQGKCRLPFHFALWALECSGARYKAGIYKLYYSVVHPVLQEACLSKSPGILPIALEMDSSIDLSTTVVCYLGISSE